MEDGCLELASSRVCNTWGTQIRCRLWPRSVPAGNSFGLLQHLLLPAPSLEPRAAPVPPPSAPMPQSPEGRTALCAAQRGGGQPRIALAPLSCRQHRPRDQHPFQEPSRSPSHPSLPGGGRPAPASFSWGYCECRPRCVHPTQPLSLGFVLPQLRSQGGHRQPPHSPQPSSAQ